MNNLMRRSGIIAVLCALLCLCLLVCSCGGGNGDETTGGDTTPVTDPETTAPETNPETNPETTAPETNPVPENVTYTVYVKDTDGNPIANVTVKICNDATCATPVATDAEGKAVFTVAEGTYFASVTAAVEGYEVDTTAEIAFPEGQTTTTITLQKKAAEVAPVEPEADGSKEHPFNVKEWNNEIRVVPGYEILDGMADGIIAPTIENAVKTYYLSVGTTFGMPRPVDADEDEEKTPVGATYYTYEATADGYVVIYVIEGANSNVSVKNVTTGVNGLPINGVGMTSVPVTKGNTYEFVVNATVEEVVDYAIIYITEADGSEDMPIYLFEGMVAYDLAIPAGESVYVRVMDTYFCIDDTDARVTLNGATRKANNAGLILGREIGLGIGNTVAISSASTADDVVTVQLTGSSAANPLVLGYEYDFVTAPAGAVVYYGVPAGESLANYVFATAFDADLALVVNGKTIEGAYVFNGSEKVIAIANVGGSREYLELDETFALLPVVEDALDVVYGFVSYDVNADENVLKVTIAPDASVTLAFDSISGMVITGLECSVPSMFSSLSLPTLVTRRMGLVSVSNEGNTTAATVEIVVTEVPAGVMDPIEVTGSKGIVAFDDLALALTVPTWQPLYVKYTAEADGFIEFTAPETVYLEEIYYVYTPAEDEEFEDSVSEPIVDEDGRIFLRKGQYVILSASVMDLEEDATVSYKFTKLANNVVVLEVEVEYAVGDEFDYADLEITLDEDHELVAGDLTPAIFGDATITLLVKYVGEDADHESGADCLTITQTGVTFDSGNLE